MRIYIAGPMTGLPEHNVPAFNRAENELIVFSDGKWQVLNPARHEGRCEDWRDYMRLGIRDVTYADAVALLDGWEDSKGATLERWVANSIGLLVRPLDEWLQG